MPIMKCQSKGNSGYKYGASGHCYPGKSGKAKAAKQGRAISISKARAAGHHIPKK
jgi:hypothetical protein